MFIALAFVFPGALYSLTVDAGPDIVLTVPGNSAQISAAISGGSVRWSCAKAPAGRSYLARFDNSAAPSTRVRFLAVGTYLVTATASDGVNTATDSLTVTILDRTPKRPKLKFAPPMLDNPEFIEAKGGQVDFKLSDGKDYLIVLDKPVQNRGRGINIDGGRTVVVFGGQIHHDNWNIEGLKRDGMNRGLLLKNQSAAIHLEGFRATGKVSDGIDIDQNNDSTTVQLQNIYVNQVEGRQDLNHADVVQTWRGPKRLHIDMLTGYTGYQGFFLAPDDLKKGYCAEEFVFSRMNIIGNEDSRYMLWVGKGGTKSVKKVTVDNIWVQPRESVIHNRDLFLWPKPVQENDHTWDAVRTGIPPGGNFVTIDHPGDPGAAYISPGYIGDE